MIVLREISRFKWMILIHCLLPLIAGTVFYILFRPFPLAANLFPAQLQRESMPGFLVNSFPDFCWSYSLAMALYLFALYFNIRRWKITLCTGVLLPGSELIQLLFPENFTFDIYDLVAVLIAFVLSYISFCIIRKNT